MFVVTIENAKNMEEMKFHIDGPMIKYCQSMSCPNHGSSLATSFDSIIKPGSTILYQRI